MLAEERMLMHQIRLLLLIFVLISAGCISSCGVKMSQDCKAFFFDLTTAQQEKEFRTYPIEKQLELYLCGMHIEPPQIGFAWYIADNGEKIVPFLVERLRSERDEFKQTNIIYIFEAMAAKGHLKGRQDIVDIIQQVISAMKGHKEESGEMLARIKRSIQQ
jgi:hypothetical protein